MLSKKNCDNCQKEFEYSPSRRPNARFCSLSCLSKMTKNEQDRKRRSDWNSQPRELIIKDMLSRYERFVIKNEDCWDWKGSKVCSKSGKFNYGVFMFRGKSMKAHRASYLIHKGEIPDGLFVLHSCDNPPCSNPDHLFLGTNADNMKDMSLKKRVNNSGRSKISPFQVKEIRELLALGLSCVLIGKKYNVSNVCIWSIKSNKSWKDIK